jgi:hypothetical protein
MTYRIDLGNKGVKPKSSSPQKRKTQPGSLRLRARDFLLLFYLPSWGNSDASAFRFQLCGLGVGGLDTLENR